MLSLGAGSPPVRALVFAMVLCSAGHSWGETEPSGSHAGIEKARAVTVEVTATRREGNRKIHTFGAGFVIHPSGLVATCVHVVPEGCTLILRLPDNRLVSARVVARYSDIDTAILKFQPAKPHAAIEVAKGAIERNTRAVVAGVPERGKRALRSAEVVALTDTVQYSRVAHGTELLRFGASISLGFSGGPLISLDGRFLGMVVARDSSGRSVGYAIPAATLLDALDVPRLVGFWPTEPTNAIAVELPMSRDMSHVFLVADRDRRSETLSEEMSFPMLR
ncbi:MAG: serine protease [Planctomycetota bacterium]